MAKFVRDNAGFIPVRLTGDFLDVRIKAERLEPFGIIGDGVSRVNGGEKVGHGAAQNQASGAAPSAMARALVT